MGLLITPGAKMLKDRATDLRSIEILVRGDFGFGVLDRATACDYNSQMGNRAAGRGENSVWRYSR